MPTLTPTPACTSALRDRQRFIYTLIRRKKEKEHRILQLCLTQKWAWWCSSESEDKLYSHAGDGYRWVRSLSRALPYSFLLTKARFPEPMLPWRQRGHHVLPAWNIPSLVHISPVPYNLIQESRLIQLTSKSQIPWTVAATVTHIWRCRDFPYYIGREIREESLWGSRSSLDCAKHSFYTSD